MILLYRRRQSENEWNGQYMDEGGKEELKEGVKKLGYIEMGRIRGKEQRNEGGEGTKGRKEGRNDGRNEEMT